MKALIIVFLIVSAIIDFIVIIEPSIKKLFYSVLNKIKRKKRRKIFEKKIKELEIK